MRAKAARPARATKPYNTALKGPLWPGRDDYGEIDFARSERGMVFAQNIVTDPPPEGFAGEIISRVGCVYCEIPWPAAGDTFYARAGIEPSSHAEYVAAVEALIARLGKPAFIVGAKRDAGRLAKDDVRLIMLNGAPAWLAVSGARAPECLHTGDLLAHLAATYPGVYDFGCGYGASLRPFAYCIGSDIDRKCLAYVAREIL
jgi:hypothetical protein